MFSLTSTGVLDWRATVADHGSVTRLLDALKAGDAAALEALWGKYFPRLAALARQRFAGHPSVRQQDEDVAVSVLTSLWQSASNGRLEAVSDRDELWRLMFVITVRKAARCARDEQRQKRGGLWTRLNPFGRQDDVLRNLPAPGLSPELVASMAEECQRRIELLPDEALRLLAARRAQGYSVQELAAELGCSRRSVERKLALIRSIWLRDGQT